MIEERQARAGLLVLSHHLLTHLELPLLLLTGQPCCLGSRHPSRNDRLGSFSMLQHMRQQCCVQHRLPGSGNLGRQAGGRTDKHHDAFLLERSQKHSRLDPHHDQEVVLQQPLVSDCRAEARYGGESGSIEGQGAVNKIQ